MSSVAFEVAGLSVTWATLVLALAVVQWLVFVGMSLASGARPPKKGFRPQERNLVASTAVFFVLWLTAMNVTAVFGGSKSSGDIAAASVTGSGSKKDAKGSCASLRIGMTEAEVRATLGKPTETRSDEDTRGPGASMLVYRDSRCAVHVVDGKVEFID